MSNPPKFEDTLPLDDEPRFEDTLPLDSSEGHSTLNSLGAGAAQGATLGFLDEMLGFFQAMAPSQKVNQLGMETKEADKVGTLKEQYQKARDTTRAELESAQQANPTAFGVGELAGGVASSFLPGMGVGKGIAGMAKIGATTGALAGLGGSNADLTEGEVEQAALDMGLGAVLGGTFGAGMGAVGKGIGYVAPKAIEKTSGFLKESAEDLASKAMGFERGSIKKLAPKDAVKMKKDYQKIGRTILDEEVFSPLSNTADNVASVKKLQDKAAKNLDSIYTVLDEANVNKPKSMEIALKVEENLNEMYGMSSYADDGAKKAYQKILDDLTDASEELSWKELQKIRHKIGNGIGKNINNPDVKSVYQQAYGILSQEIESGTEETAEKIGVASLKDALKTSNLQYKTAKQLEEPLANKFAKEQGNKLLGLTDWGIISGSLATTPLTGGMSIPMAVAGTVGKKAAEKYGNQVISLSTDKIADILAKSPQTFGKFAPSLQQAAKRGTQALIAAHFVMQQRDPEYRKTIEGIEADGQ